jgi:hypothetical protein
MPKHGPQFEIRPAKVGGAYSIVVDWGHGLTEAISDFHSEQEAQNWIDAKSKAWTEERLKRKSGA